MRQARQQKAKEKSKVEKLILPSSFSPNADSIVLTLPGDLTDDGRMWWNPWAGEGNEFDVHKGNKGAPTGAMGWVREKFVKEWWDVHFPQATHASTNERLWFFKDSGIGRGCGHFVFMT
jgi:hypothetical protein